MPRPKSIRLFAACCIVFTFSLTTTHAQWIQSLRRGDIAYFLFATSPRLERYSFTSGQWLEPINLPAVYGAASVFHVDAEGLYVAYGQAVKQYSLSGSNEVHLLNTVEPVQGIFSDGDILFVNHTSGLYARFTSLNKTNGAIVAQFENYVDSVYGAAIAPSINKIFGRSLGISPPDITYVSYNDDGMFLAGGDSPHHGDYPGANRVWVFPGDAKVVDDSGTVYSTGNLTFLNSFGGSINDLDFYGTDIPIVLRDSTLIAYSNSLLPVGSRSLSFTPRNIYVGGTNILTFTPDASTAHGIRVDVVPVSTLNPPTPGQPVDPNGLSYTPDNAFLDRNGILYLLSKSQQSLFRWDTLNQRYLVTIPLLEVPSYAAYSEDNHHFYIAYPSGLIRQIDLVSTNLAETPFANLPGRPLGLATAGRYVFAADPSGAWGTHYTFDPAGTRIASRDWNYFSSEYIWSEPNQKMYFFRDDTSPNDLLWEQINADGMTYTNLSPGGIGVYFDSPLHDSAGFIHPIRVAPNGSVVVLGSGVIHDAVTLARLAVSLANSVTDAAWVGDRLGTIRTISNLTQFQQWNGPNYAQGAVRQVPGTAHQLLTLNTNQLLAVSIQNGKPSFYVMDGDFNIVAPPGFDPPIGLSVSVVTSSQVNLSWNDVNGEESYAIERKTGNAGAWAEIGTTSASTTDFPDGSVSLGNVYFYRVIARNGARSSIPSAEISASLVIPDAPTNASAESLSASSILVSWADVQFEISYQLERKTGLSGSWMPLVTLNADSISYTDTGLTPNTDYYYRLRAANGIGTSAYSVTATAKTAPVPPTVPSLTSASAQSPFSVVLFWSNSSYEDNYVIERRTGTNLVWSVLAILARDIATYTDYTVSNATIYDYRLYATNAAGSSGYSNLRTVATPQIPPPPAPAGLSARPLSLSTLLITWNDVSFETGYRLERRTESPAPWALVALLPANTVSYTDTNLVEDTQYFYRLQSFNTYGNSSYSNEADAVPVNIVDLIQDDFDPNLNVAVWASVTGGVATNGGQGFRGSQALWFGAGGARSATSIALDVSRGGTIEFALRAGSESLDGNLFWNNSEAGESVVLEYSKDGGNSWVAIQTFNTVYPSLSNWTVFSIAVPAGAASPNTQFRWRQLANSGAGTDAWALDDVRVQGVAPAPPDAPPFIISSPSSSTSIAVLWIEADRAMSYVLERRQGTNSWVPLTTRTVSMTYYTDVTVLPATAYSYRVKAVNAGGVSPYSSTTTSTAWSQIEEWLFLNYGTPDALSDGGMKTAGADGTRPLVRFAFGLTASEPARTLIPGQSASGFPAIWLDSARDRLCVEFVRRKNSTNPGIAYTVLFGSSLIDWTPGGVQVSAVSIDSIWERVRYEDTITASQAPARFCQVTVRSQ